jgi:Zn-dependent peptidase ImmA (M78 family)
MGLKIMTYLEIQNEVIKKYQIVIVENSTCKSRTHAHCDGTRRICKWKQANSLQSTFTLLHEIGHIMTKTSKMRRCESEYYATIWALEKCKEYNLIITDKILNLYQDYINRELDRGIRRGGLNYNSNYDLSKYNSNEIKELKIKLPKNVNLKKMRII